ncbi:Uncharacterised protein [Sphingobacterium multivorum]|uniref:Uncharacterized protein n=1 Tax=Sphingobacterium multivorum TaxID=28454 RepID=A0A2X2IU23_SPHMU|nr:Uncharacterised protein [Sphingobacterium multivorum]
MKFSLILIALFWLISYIVVVVQIAKSKGRIPFLSIILMFLFPFLWVFFAQQLSRVEEVSKTKKKKYI